MSTQGRTKTRAFGSAGRIVKDSFSHYPGRSATVIGSIVLSGFVESLGLLTVLPIINIAMGKRGLGTAGAVPSKFESGLDSFLGFFHLPPTLAVLLGLVVITFALKAVLLLTARTYLGDVTSFVATELRLKLVRALLSASWPHFISHPAGRFGNALSTEASRAATSYMAVWYMLASAIQTLIFLAVSFMLSPEVFVAGLLVGSLIAFCLSWTIRVARQAGMRETNLMNLLIARLTDHLNGIKPLKSMGVEKLLLPFMEEDAQGLRQAQRHQAFATAAQGTMSEPLVIFFLAIGLFWAVTYTTIALPRLLILAAIFQRIMGRVGEFQKYYQMMSATESAYLSIAKATDDAANSAHVEAKEGGKFAPLKQAIRFDHVNFSYESRPVLEDASFRIPANGLTTFYGPSGSGKTTIADLISGLLIPKQGEIWFDDIPYRWLDKNALRRSIGYVPQEVFLFHDSLFNNITLRDPALTEADVWAALERADASDFVWQLEQGLHSNIGERGARLSGGQRQRVMIARALVRRPSLLILDEATTALDPKTEQMLCQTIKTLAKDTTVIAISHQPAIKQISDHVVDMAELKGI